MSCKPTEVKDMVARYTDGGKLNTIGLSKRLYFLELSQLPPDADNTELWYWTE